MYNFSLNLIDDKKILKTSIPFDCYDLIHSKSKFCETCVNECTVLVSHLFCTNEVKSFKNSVKQHIELTSLVVWKTKADESIEKIK